jgi:hypothetical protein
VKRKRTRFPAAFLALSPRPFGSMLLPWVAYRFSRHTISYSSTCASQSAVIQPIVGAENPGPTLSHFMLCKEVAESSRREWYVVSSHHSQAAQKRRPRRLLVRAFALMPNFVRVLLPLFPPSANLGTMDHMPGLSLVDLRNAQI